VIALDIDGRLRHVNNAAESFLGSSNEMLCERMTSDVITIADVDTQQLVDSHCVFFQQNDDNYYLVSGGRLAPKLMQPRMMLISTIPIKTLNPKRQIVGVGLVFQKARITSDRYRFSERLQDVVESVSPLQQHALLYLKLEACDRVRRDRAYKNGHEIDDAVMDEVIKLIQPLINPADTFAQLEQSGIGLLLLDCPRWRALRVARALRSSMQFLSIPARESMGLNIHIGCVAINGNHNDHLERFAAAQQACEQSVSVGPSRIVLEPATIGMSDVRVGIA